MEENLNYTRLARRQRQQNTGGKENEKQYRYYNVEVHNILA
jgi:hypothetical protein